jgi:hypothetical protein
MSYSLEILKVTRKNIIRDIANLSVEQFNVIPNGFNNNIVWNLAHLVATQQLLVYGLSATPFVVPQEVIDLYRKGTAPTAVVDEKQIEEYKSLLISTIDQMEQDYKNGVFGEDYRAYTTSYGMTLSSVEEAIEFNNVHDAMHYGMIKMMLRMV